MSYRFRDQYEQDRGIPNQWSPASYFCLSHVFGITVDLKEVQKS